MIVLGSLTAQRHDLITNSDSDIGHSAQLALRRATVIRLEAGLTDAERVEAERRYPKERFEAGIGEQLVAVDQLLSRYDDARGGANPHGWAVVQAVIDWTRIDVGRPIRKHELLALCPDYLHDLRPLDRHDDKGHEDALGWAGRPVVSHIALLKEVSSDFHEPSYVPFDYLVAAADGQGGRPPQPILDLAWDKIRALVSPSEADRVGESASLRRFPLLAQRIFIASALEAAVGQGLVVESSAWRELSDVSVGEVRARFVGRGRERALWLLGAAVLIVVLLAIAQPLKWPLWVQVGLAGLAALAALIIPELQARSQQGETRARLVEQGLAVSGGHVRLPRVRDVSLEQLRVHAARVQVPYIERDQQDKLEAVVGPGQAVLVVGHSMSGKTRLAAEVVQRKFPDALLVAAESGKALRELFDEGLDPADVVVWLDDLERFLGADGLTKGLLDRLTAGGAIVVATIRVSQREIYRPRDELRPPEWDVLQRFSEILLERRLAHSELDRVRVSVKSRGVLAAVEQYGLGEYLAAGPEILAAVEHYGLAEYLGAGPEALDKFEKGAIANPVGQALVRAAVDWRRAGLARPVSKQVLTMALPTYLADRPDVPRTNQAIEEGLAWATAKINETVALLGQVFTGSDGPLFEAFDYLIDQLDRPSMPVPEQMWALALEQAGPSELFGIGEAAKRAGMLAVAAAAYQQAVASGHVDAVPIGIAANNLGELLEEQGDLEGAKAAYQQAIASGHPDVVPRAAVNLGVLLEEQGDVEGAKAAYQQVIDSGHADEAPRGVYNLGVLLEEQGDLEGAKAAYQLVIDSGHPLWVPNATSDLNRLLRPSDE